MENKFELSREIPKIIKREIRQRCKFCCIICENGLFQYHHFNPEYQFAKQHDPNGITLLCPNHHSEATTKLLTFEQITEADKRRTVDSATPSRETPVFNAPLTVVLGNYIFP